MKIKVGEYVRTKDGVIFKILTKDKSDFGNHYYGITDNENYSNYTYGKGSHNDIKNKILKHSFNIIDLIEVGDIIEINNEKYEVIFDKSMDKLGVLIPNRDYLEIRHSALEHIFNEYKDIRIITKEQYERDCYTVEEEE